MEKTEQRPKKGPRAADRVHKRRQGYLNSDNCSASRELEVTPLCDGKFADSFVIQEADPSLWQVEIAKLAIQTKATWSIQGCSYSFPKVRVNILWISNKTQHFFSSYALFKYVSAYAFTDTYFVSSTESYTKSFSWSSSVLLERGSLYQVERGSTPIQRESLPFSDCLLWLVPLEPLSCDWNWSWSGSIAASVKSRLALSIWYVP